MTTIIVDGNNLGIASHFANSELVDSHGRPSGAIYGFIRSIRPIMGRVQHETGNDQIKVSVAWDSMTSWRKEVLPTYKASRSDKSADVAEDFEKYVDQLPRLRDLLKIMGIPQMRADNYEADDIAGHLCRTLSNQVVLVSNDYDWLQLVSKRVHVWRTLKHEYVTPVNFKEVTGCENTQEFVDMKALTGDKDEVPGCPGVGDKFALRYLRGDLVKGKKFEAIEEWIASGSRDESLLLFDLRNIEIPKDAWRITKGDFDITAIAGQMRELSFNSILGDFDDWISPFKKSSEEK